MNVNVRLINIDDLKLLQQIACETFLETFASDNNKDDINQYLTEKFSPEALGYELNNPESEFYFAEINNDVVGYLKLNFGHAQTEVQSDQSVEIERIYVSGQHQGKKIGQLLFQTAIDVAKQEQAHYIWLGVWENNAKAIGFYKKNGFVEFDKHFFILGNDKQTDIMMKLQLQA